MQIKSTRKDVVWSYIGIIVSMASNFLMLPFMMRLIDADYLGLWYVFQSIGAIVSLFDFGFNPTLARNVAYVWSGADKLSPEGLADERIGKPNFQLLANVLCTCRLIYLLISLIALIGLLSAGSLYIFRISSEIRDSSITVSWFIYVSAVFMNLYYGYYATILRGVGAVSEYNKINVFSRTVQIVVSISLLYLGLGIVSVSLAYLLYGFLLRFISKHTLFNYNQIGITIEEKTTKVSFSEIKSLFLIVWHNAWRDGMVSIANYCASHASTLIASTFLSLRLTGIYSISVQLVNAIATISAALYTAYQPAMQSAYANKDRVEAKRLMSVAMVAFSGLFWLGVFALESIGIPMLKSIRPDYEYDRLVIFGIAFYSFFYCRQSYYASFISNTNHVPYMKAYVISGIAGVSISAYLVGVSRVGLWGLILGQFFTQAVYNCWKWPSLVHKMLNTNTIDMARVGIKSIAGMIRQKKGSCNRAQ